MIAESSKSLMVAVVATIALAAPPSLAQAQAADSNSFAAAQPDSTWTARGLADGRQIPRSEYFLLGAGGGAVMAWRAVRFDVDGRDTKDVDIVLAAATVLAVAGFFTASLGPREVPEGADADAYVAAWRREAAARRRVSLLVGTLIGALGMVVIQSSIPAT